MAAAIARQEQSFEAERQELEERSERLRSSLAAARAEVMMAKEACRETH